MARAFKYSCTLSDHTGDVRVVKSCDKDTIISGSRDKTIRVWKRFDKIFQSTSTLSYHQNYIASLDYRESDASILSGSNDKSIFCFDTRNESIKFVAEGHKDSVCGLKAFNETVVLSCSWDSTIKVWNNDKCVCTLTGHSGPVWSVALLKASSSNSLLRFCSAGADKKIFLWELNLDNLSGSVSPKSTLLGHTDCIRSVVDLGNSLIASCGNDASIRIWNINTAQVVSEGFGHSNFIYSLSFDAKANLLASSAEDRTVRIWDLSDLSKELNCIQVITLPCISVWCVDFLANGDFVCGGSDAKLRVFTRNAEFEASPDQLEVYKAEIAANKISANTTEGSLLAGNKDLPGVEALTVPGTKEGQVMVVKDGSSVVCFQWNSVESQWLKVGDVVGSDENTKKTFFNGQEYDFVFDVDIDPSKPMLKIPFNKNEDPWVVAQTFINTNDLPQDYLETVANFICQNAGINKPAACFNRNMDPYTGSDAADNEPTSQYIPISIYVPMAEVNFPALLKKLKEINTTLDVSRQCDPQVIDQIEELISNQKLNSEENISEIIKSLVNVLKKDWTNAHLIPIFDFLRYSASFKKSIPILFDRATLDHLHKQSIDNINPLQMETVTCAMLLIKVYSNVLCHGESLDKAYQSLAVLKFMETLERLLDANLIPLAKNKMIQVALATYYHNACVFLMKNEAFANREGLLDKVAIYTIVLLNYLLDVYSIDSSSIHPEFLFRAIVTCGTILRHKKQNDTSYQSIIDNSCKIGAESGNVSRSRQERLVEAIEKVTTISSQSERNQVAARELLYFLR